jgi:hypothetical protein
VVFVDEVVYRSHSATLGGHGAYQSGEALTVARRPDAVEAGLHTSVGHHLQGKLSSPLLLLELASLFTV